MSTSIARREAPKARARRNRAVDEAQQGDSLQQSFIPVKTDSLFVIPEDSLIKIVQDAESLIDSLERANRENLETLEAPIDITEVKDSIILPPPPPPAPKKHREVWMPNSTKATWYAVVFPGGGQIYNRKFWKLPIIYGGFAGCAYALSWNGKMYNDYSQAYIDIMDDDPNTNSFLDLLPSRVSNYSEAQLKDIIRRRKDTFRRYRDLSIFAIIGVYLISVVDAYVDAELSNFDIGPDLSMRIEPAIINTNRGYRNSGVGLQWSFRF